MLGMIITTALLLIISFHDKLPFFVYLIGDICDPNYVKDLFGISPIPFFIVRLRSEKTTCLFNSFCQFPFHASFSAHLFVARGKNTCSVGRSHRSQIVGFTPDRDLSSKSSFRCPVHLEA